MSALEMTLVHARDNLAGIPPSAQPAPPLGFWSTILWTAAGIMAALSGLVLLTGLMKGWNDARPAQAINLTSDVTNSVASGIALLMFFAILAAACRYSGSQPAAYLGVQRPRGRYVLMSLIALLISSTITAGLCALGGLAEGADEPVSMTTITSLVILAPVGEELVFRGFLFRGFAASRLGSVGAIVLTSLLWASVHTDKTWLGFVDVFAAGLVWGWLRWHTGSTLTTVAVHAVTNSLIVIAVATGLDLL